MKTVLSILLFSVLLVSPIFLSGQTYQLSPQVLGPLEKGLHFERLDSEGIHLISVEERAIEGAAEYRAAISMSIVEGNPYKIDIEGWYDYLRTRKPIWNCERKGILAKQSEAYYFQTERLCAPPSAKRIPGGDQFIPRGSLFIPGGDQFIPGGGSVFKEARRSLLFNHRYRVPIKSTPSYHSLKCRLSICLDSMGSIFRFCFLGKICFISSRNCRLAMLPINNLIP